MIYLTIAKNAGFCFGVKRAIDETNNLLSKNNKIYCVGDIIHNQHVIDNLKNKGLIIINEDEIKNIKNSEVIIRSHGIEKEYINILNENKNKIYDLTCPFVKKIHNIVEEQSKIKDVCIIVGDKNHPEIKGIKSYVECENYIINSEDDTKMLKLSKNRSFFVVSQTTANLKNFQKIIDILCKISYNICIFNTICKSTEDRQNEAEHLAKINDVVLVVGSKSSSNTKKLYNLSKEITKTYFVENKEDMTSLSIKDKSKVCILAGASTPLDLIEEISFYARSKF